VVRKAITQTVAIQNTEDKEWAINPTISSTKGTANYEVTYTPMLMTTK